MNRKLIAALTLALIAGVVGTVFGQTGRGSGGGASRITLYSSDGKALQEWRTPGKVEVQNGVFSFVDGKTDHAIRIAGTIIVDSAP